MIEALSQFSFGGHTYQLQQTMAGTALAPTGSGLSGYMRALKGCPPAFAAQLVRSMVLSQARFVFRGARGSSSPGRLFGTTDLALLEQPWPKGTTSQLLTLMEWHAGVAGNAYVWRTDNGLKVLNPGWVSVVLGSASEPSDPADAIDAEIVGYLFHPGGLSSGKQPRTLLPAEVAHWAPLPDPETPSVGMSWLTPAVQEMQGDQAATAHKLKFFENGATPNMVVKGIPAMNDDEFKRLVKLMDEQYSGVANAYKTLYLVAGADATVVGSDMAQMAFKDTQGAGETRIAMLARVPTVVLQASEGLQGSALNAGNFGQARRLFSDSWLYPTLQSVAATLGGIVTVPGGADLWFDTGDMPFVREDASDLADIQQKQAATVKTLVDAGYSPESAVNAVQANDFSQLQHTGLVSVQLQKPGATAPTTGEPDA
ncbi:MAG TPA: phage portal protein [Mycobacteriales bacterium]|nr:phage portal protein [Mycobacteriales bacterium]